MPRTPAVPAADPLADLRDVSSLAAVEGPSAAPAPLPGPAASTETQDEPAAPGEAQGLVTDALWHQAAVALMVATWHRDRTAQSLGHGGGTCGCVYLARMALVAVHGQPVVALNPEPEADGDE
jgi:hypothetical protein